MFAPSNLATTNNGRQRASTKDGYIEIETADAYGDLSTTWDVVMAWVTLQAIWQKLFPDWPVAVIGLKTIFSMRLFQHCGKDDKKLMIEYSNKLLKANALRAANKEAPMSFERSLNLAGNVCHAKGYEREPPAARSLTQNQQGGSQNFSRGGGSTSSFRGRGGLSGGSSRGGAAGPVGSRQASVSVVSLANGQKVCNFWQTNACREQGLAFCTRNTGKFLHVCSYVKTGGQVCGRKDHKKSEHDPTKH